MEASLQAAGNPDKRRGGDVHAKEQTETMGPGSCPEVLRGTPSRSSQPVNSMLYPNLAGNEEGVALLMEAHRAAARANMSASNQLAAAAGEAGCDLKDAFIAALSVTGGHHAPVTEIREFLCGLLARPNRASVVCQALAEKKLPGFGNSFFKGESDPATLDFARWLAVEHDSYTALLEEIGGICLESGKVLFPNIGAHTAIMAEILGMPRGTELLLFALPRLEIWTEHFVNARR